MSCTDLRDLLSAYADGEVGPAQREMLDMHLERCRTCQVRLCDYRKARALLVSLPGDGWAPPAPFSAPSPRRVPTLRGFNRYVCYLVPAILLALTVAGTAPLWGRIGGLPGSLPAVGSHARTAGRLPTADARSESGLAAAAALPEEDRGAIVVLVYRADGRHIIRRRHVAVGQVDDLAQTWSSLVQVLHRDAAGSGAASVESQRGPLTGDQRVRAPRWSAARAI